MGDMMMAHGRVAALVALLAGGVGPGAFAQGQPDALAQAFGARETVISASLSSDGQKIALIAAGPGRTTRAFVVDAKEGSEPRVVASTSGKPEYLSQCDWVGPDRLACQIYAEQRYNDDVYSASNMFAVDTNGSNAKLLSQRRGANALSVDFRGGEIVDLLPAEDGQILMTRSYVPEAKIGSLVEKKLEGLGVDRIDTRTGASKRIEQPQRLALEYISDGQGTIRIMGLQENKGSGYVKGTYRYLYRPAGVSDWRELSVYDIRDRSGFRPLAVDRQKNVAYGFEKTDGRAALVTIFAGWGTGKEGYFRPSEG